MMDNDLDQSLVRNITVDKDQQEYQMKYVCDEVTYMMFDLERGGFLNYHGQTVEIDSLWKFKYKRIPVNESIIDNIQTIISNFEITVWYNESIILDFLVFGNERKFTVKQVEGFHTGMFINKLDEYRKIKFDKT